MHDKAIITAGLVIFVALVTCPFWYTLGAGDASPPDLELPDRSDASLFETEDDYHCVEKDMAARHMGLLNEWRDAVVRGDGTKQYHQSVDFPGEQCEMSLTGTCMKCHTSRETFCRRCHEYADVLPFELPQESTAARRGIRCWDCHIDTVGD
ncbi:MAG TPA: sulfate reduction electron transfer complex DsrMKJOP subunit DsrJ [Thermoguttaceae bacterium]|nr:sulfate reduction electron transfer complex DsrMKJOP subunit DsrJ [Thermoguttaceae bacterium]